jgi:hypothetical protein
LGQLSWCERHGGGQNQQADGRIYNGAHHLGLADAISNDFASEYYFVAVKPENRIRRDEIQVTHARAFFVG